VAFAVYFLQFFPVETQCLRLGLRFGSRHKTQVRTQVKNKNKTENKTENETQALRLYKSQFLIFTTLKKYKQNEKNQQDERLFVAIAFSAALFFGGIANARPNNSPICQHRKDVRSS